MAWPCISRVCCLARFWDQLDKSDLAVPLTIHNYSDLDEAAEEEEAGGGGAPSQQQQQQQLRVPTGGNGPTGRAPRARGGPPVGLPASASAPSLVQQESLGAVQRLSKKAPPLPLPPRHKEPFAAETQYRQDFRAWPVRKRDALPWVGEPRRGEVTGAAPSSPAGLPGAAQVYILPMAGQLQESGTTRYSYKQQPAWPSSFSPPAGVLETTTSYRHEYRPWTGAKRSRPTKTTQGFVIPEDHFAQESSYKADFKIPEVKAKFSPNPSAVFQAPSRILNV